MEARIFLFSGAHAGRVSAVSSPSTRRLPDFALARIIQGGTHCSACDTIVPKSTLSWGPGIDDKKHFRTQDTAQAQGVNLHTK